MDSYFFFQLPNPDSCLDFLTPFYSTVILKNVYEKCIIWSVWYSGSTKPIFCISPNLCVIPGFCIILSFCIPYIFHAFCVSFSSKKVIVNW